MSHFNQKTRKHTAMSISAIGELFESLWAIGVFVRRDSEESFNMAGSAEQLREARRQTDAFFRSFEEHASAARSAPDDDDTTSTARGAPDNDDTTPSSPEDLDDVEVKPSDVPD